MGGFFLCTNRSLIGVVPDPVFLCQVPYCHSFSSDIRCQPAVFQFALSMNICAPFVTLLYQFAIYSLWLCLVTTHQEESYTVEDISSSNVGRVKKKSYKTSRSVFKALQFYYPYFGLLCLFHVFQLILFQSSPACIESLPSLTCPTFGSLLLFCMYAISPHKGDPLTLSG